MTPSRSLNRRQFIGQASCAAIGSTCLFSTLLNLRMASAASLAANPTDYRALVCVFLSGGNDSWNVLVPKGASANAFEYLEYAQTRSNLALSQSQLIKINPLQTDGRVFGVHPGMPEIAALFNSGKLAFVTNVGSLLRPTTLADYNNNSNLPLGLFAHSIQQQQWQTSICNQTSEIGWGGRAADLLQSMNSESQLSMNISLAGTNIWQSGNQVVSYSLSPSGAPVLSSHYAGTANGVLRETALNSQLDIQYRNLFAQTFAQNARTGIESNLFFEKSLGTLPANVSAMFPSGPFGDQLKMTARIIAARGSFGVRRQTFFIAFDGFDFHENLIPDMASMMPILSQGINAFDQAMVSLGVEDDVTLFQTSDFGRTLASNGPGADHGWGGNTFVMGGAVKGQQIFGTYPSLALGNPHDTGLGRLIPGISVDQYAAELALWFGVSPTDLSQVLPNIGSFYGGIGQPIGFMTM